MPIVNSFEKTVDALWNSIRHLAVSLICDCFKMCMVKRKYS